MALAALLKGGKMLKRLDVLFSVIAFAVSLAALTPQKLLGQGGCQECWEDWTCHYRIGALWHECYHEAGTTECTVSSPCDPMRSQGDFALAPDGTVHPSVVKLYLATIDRSTQVKPGRSSCPGGRLLPAKRYSQKASAAIRRNTRQLTV
jgi:hypothetical protein